MTTHQRSPAILNLPPELIQHIALFLPKCSQAALALTCHSLYTIITEQFTWDTLKSRLVRRETCTNPPFYSSQDAEARWQLLNLLARDLCMTHVLCHFCRILHPTTMPERKGCIWNEASGPKWWNLGKLRFSDAREAVQEYLAIRSDNKGPVLIPSLSISTSWTKHPGDAASMEENLGTGITQENFQYKERYVKLDTVAVGIPGYGLYHHSTQRLWIPSLPPSNTLTSDGESKKTLLGRLVDLVVSPESVSPPPPYANHGFQICKHHSIYAPPQDPQSEYEWVFRKDVDPRDHHDTTVKCAIDDLVEAHWLYANDWPVPRNHKAARMTICREATGRSDESTVPQLNPIFLQGQGQEDTEFHDLEEVTVLPPEIVNLGLGSISSSWCCSRCRTTAKLKTIKHPGGRGIEFILDVWQNLGCCDVPESSTWAEHWGIDKLHCRRRRGRRPGAKLEKNPDINFRPSIKIPPCISVITHPSCAHNDWDQPSCCGVKFTDGYLETIMAFTDKDRHLIKARSDHVDNNLPVFEDHFCPGKNCAITSPSHEKTVDEGLINEWEKIGNGCRPLNTTTNWDFTCVLCAEDVQARNGMSFRPRPFRIPSDLGWGAESETGLTHRSAGEVMARWAALSATLFVS